MPGVREGVPGGSAVKLAVREELPEIEDKVREDLLLQLEVRAGGRETERAGLSQAVTSIRIIYRKKPVAGRIPNAGVASRK